MAALSSLGTSSEQILSQYSSNNNNTQHAVLAEMPLITHPSQWAEPQLLACTLQLYIHAYLNMKLTQLT